MVLYNTKGYKMGYVRAKEVSKKKMGKVIEKVKITNFYEPTRSLELEAIIDTGATMLVLPQDIVDRLNLKEMRETKVRYANNKIEVKPVYGVVTLEIKGRAGEFNVLAEPEGFQPLVGQIILEQLDLVVDPSLRKVSPNPRSPEMPLVDIFMAIPHAPLCGGAPGRMKIF